MRVAIPRMGETVAPCFEYSATMAIFEIGDSGLVRHFEFPLRSREPFDRVRLLRDQNVDTLICGGIQAFYEDLLRASGLEVISWVSGTVDDLLALFLRGELVSGTELPGGSGPSFPSIERTTEC